MSALCFSLFYCADLARVCFSSTMSELIKASIKMRAIDGVCCGEFARAWSGPPAGNERVWRRVPLTAQGMYRSPESAIICENTRALAAWEAFGKSPAGGGERHFVISSIYPAESCFSRRERLSLPARFMGGCLLCCFAHRAD